MPNVNQSQLTQSQPKITSIEELNRRASIPKGVKIVKKGSNALDRDSFLKLLLTKLSHQDPIKPVEDQAFIAQMAQFSALEQMNNVSTELRNLKKLQANQLIGKVVSGRDFINQKSVITGKVSQVIHDKDGNLFLTVNGKRVKLDDVLMVAEASKEPASQPGEFNIPKKMSTQPKNVSRETLHRSKSDQSNVSNYLDNQQIQKTLPQPSKKLPAK